MGDYLIHYGVKGMKWGVRKEQPSAEQMKKTLEYKRLSNFRKDYNREPYKAEEIPSLYYLNKKKEKKLWAKYDAKRGRVEASRDKALDKLEKKHKIDDLYKKYEKQVVADIKKHGNDPRDYSDYVWYEAMNKVYKDKSMKSYDKSYNKIWDKYEAKQKAIGKSYVKKFNKNALNEAGWTGSYKKGVKALESVKKDYVVIGEGNVWPRDYWS